jgi:hypothetical protein
MMKEFVHPKKIKDHRKYPKEMCINAEVNDK